MNSLSRLLAECSERIPSRTIVAASVMKPLRVEREASIGEVDSHFIAMCTFFAGHICFGWFVRVGSSIGGGYLRLEQR